MSQYVADTIKVGNVVMQNDFDSRLVFVQKEPELLFPSCILWEVLLISSLGGLAV